MMTMAIRRSSRISASSVNSSQDEIVAIGPPSTTRRRVNAKSSSSAAAVTATTTTTTTTTAASASAPSSKRTKTATSLSTSKHAESKNPRSRSDSKPRDVVDEPNETDKSDITLGAFVPIRPAKGRIKRKHASDSQTDSDPISTESPPIQPLTQPSSRRTRNAASDETNRVALVTKAATQTKRKARQTLGEEQAGDFIFTRVKTSSSSSTNGNGHSSSSKPSNNATSAAQHAGPSRIKMGGIIFEPLSDAIDGESFVIRKNQAFRAGLEKHPAPSSSSSSSGSRPRDSSRRSSLGLKVAKRMSSLRDGTAAYPHDSVPDHELYRHCSADLPPVIRMKHLIGWMLKRSVLIATGKQDLSNTATNNKKGKAKKVDLQDQPLPLFSDAEKKELGQREEEIERVLLQLLSDLNDGIFGINWMGRQEEQPEGPQLQPHPRNVSNTDTLSRLTATVESMSKESQDWARELTRIEDYEAETQRLEQLIEQRNQTEIDVEEVGDVSNELDEVIEWNQNDLDQECLEQLRDADVTLAWLDRLAIGVQQPLLDPESSKKKTSKGKSKSRSSKAANAADSEDLDCQVEGSELDPRWTDVEFNVDLFRSRSHQFAQFESLASRYIRTVSAHAAQVLRDRSSSLSSSSLLSYPSKSGTTTTTAAKKKGALTVLGGGGGGETTDESNTNTDTTDRLEKLMSGIRESRFVVNPSQSSESENHEKQVTVHFDPDESDAMDLLRALAKS